MMRIDKELVNRHLVSSRSKAQELVSEGAVLLNGEIVTKSSCQVKEEDEITIQKNDTLKYVSRAGLKLEKALHLFSISVKDKIAMDIGSSTGGFTDCLLQFGAKKVYAIDVGTNLMVDTLKKDSRVELHEQTHIKDLPSKYFHSIDLITVDVSFIPLEKVISRIASEEIFVDMICLIKPQFECGVEMATKYKGVILNKKVHLQVLKKVISMFNHYGFYLKGLSFSPICGKDGNIEYISYFSNQQEKSNRTIDLENLVKSSFQHHK